MPGINTIISGYSGLSAFGKNTYTRPEPTTTPPHAGNRAEKDIFEQGQWWKNRVTNATGQFPNHAVNAYHGQAGPGHPVVNVEKPEGENPAKESSPSDNVRRPQDIESSGKERDSRVDKETGEKENLFAPKGLDGEPLDKGEMIVIAELKKIDVAVHAHEMAHQAAGGSYVRGGASYQYKRGPDGKRYAVSGEVRIDTSEESTPEKTIAKMRTVRAAALAPVDPSPQDRRVAAAASAAITEARQEQRIIELEAQKKMSEAAVQKRENKGDSATGGIEGSEASQPGSELSGQPAERDKPSTLEAGPYPHGYSAHPPNNSTRYANGGMDIIV